MSEPRLKCVRKTAGNLLIVLSLAFVVVGCASLYRTLGLSEDTAEEQAALDQAALQDAVKDAVDQVQADLAAGQDLKTVAVKAGSAFAWQIATVLVSGIGAVISGFLAKWLKTERKITAAVVTGVEKADKSEIKESIQREAIAAGVEPVLHKRVKALTSG